MQIGFDVLAQGVAILNAMFPCIVIEPQGVKQLNGSIGSANAQLAMLDSGYAEKQRATLSIKATEFTTAEVDMFLPKQRITVRTISSGDEQKWLIDSVDTLDTVVYTFQLVQDW